MRIAGKALVLGLLLGATAWSHAAAPAWWSERGVTNPGATANDFAAANIGQVKQIAKQAALEMDARLPGGAGPEVTALIASWTQAPAEGVGRNDYAAVTHGQLKAVAKIFYNRLAEAGCTGAPLAPGELYPWTADTGDDTSYAPANIGQVKFLFSFDLVDNDHDGLPDIWERRYFDHLAYGPAADPGGVGRTLLESYQQNLSPWPEAVVNGGLRAWYRADLGVVKNGEGKVSHWADLSGHGFGVSETSQAVHQPEFVATAMNGQPAVKFVSATKLATLGEVDLQDGAGDITIIAVVRPNAEQWYSATIFYCGGDGNSNFGLSSGWPSNQFQLIWRDADGNTRYAPRVTATIGKVQVISVLKDGTQAAGYLNGMRHGSQEIPGGMGLLPSRLAVGNSRDPYYGFDGEIAELLVYNRALSTTERQAVEAALAARYVDPDEDGDGLPDAWEDQHLGTRSYGATDDPGNVGRTLLQSYQQGLSPWAAPTLTNGLRAWYRADTGVTKDGDNKVSQWTDLSGNGFHVAQSAEASRRPLYVASAMNNQPAVQYDDWLRSLVTPAPVDVSAGADDATVIAVVRPQGDPNYGGTIFYWGTDGNYNMGLTSPNGAGNQYGMIWRDDDGNTRLSPTAAASVDQVQIIATTKAGVAARAYRNGILQGQGEVPAGMDLQPSQLGVGNAAYPYSAFHGQIAEVLVYNRALSAAERQSVEAALIAKYINPDEDGDGLPDVWEDQYLGTRSHGAGDDPGGVGRTLFQSYQQNLSPWPAAVVGDGLRAWYRADAGIKKDGDDKVRQWVDVSGHGFHVVQEADAGRRPLYVASAINDHPAVQYDESIKALVTPGLADVSAGADDATVIAVVRPQGEPNYAGTIFYWDSDGNYNMGLSSPNGSGNEYAMIWRADDGSTRLSPRAAAAVDQVQILSVAKAGTVAAAYRNGILQGQSEVPAGMDLQPSRLGVGNSSYPYYSFHGQIAEVLVYNRALSAAERQSVEAALIAKYINLDEDGDGLPDTWEDQYLGTRTYGAGDDPYEVGRTLLQSYTQNLSPLPTPTVASGLRAWYRADQGVTKGTDNKVSQWTDASGHGFHVAQEADAGRRPLYVASAMNAHPAVQYDEWTKALVTPGLADVSAGADDATIIAVVRPQGEPNYAGTIFYWDTDGNYNMGLSSPNGSGNQYAMIWRADDGSTRLSPKAAATVDGVQIISVAKAGTTASAYRNGTLQGESEVPAGMDLQPSRLGVGNSSYPYYAFHGQIAEVLVYNRALSAAERESVEAALAAKYIDLDEDDDGLPDAWEDQYLGTRGHGAGDDPGGVGRTLLESYQQNLSPWPAPLVADGLRAWFRADKGVVKDGSNQVGTWADVTGHGFHLFQAEAGRQPLWQTGALNDRPVVEFSGLTMALQTAGAVDVFDGSNDISVVAVLKPTATQPDSVTLLDFSDVTFRLQGGVYNYFGAVWLDPVSSNYVSTASTSLIGAQAQVFTFSKQGTNVKAFRDGVKLADETLGLTEAPLAQGARVMTLAALSNNVSTFNGQIAEILIYNRALTGAERASIETGLAAKYISADADGDGVPDAWEDQYLGTRSHGANEDPGGVGRTLLQSYQQNLSPWPAPVVGGGLRAWYRADKGVVKDGANKVGRWADLSGHAFHVGQVDDSKKPAWQGFGIHGQPAVNFGNGATALQTSVPTDLLGGDSNVTIITVLRPAADQAQGNTLLDISPEVLRLWQTPTTNRFELLWKQPEPGYDFANGGAATLADNQPQILAMVKNGTNLKSFVDGTIQTDESVWWLTEAPLRPGESFTLGAMGNQLAGFHGLIAEVLVYNRVLTDAERQQVESALHARYLESTQKIAAGGDQSLIIHYNHGVSTWGHNALGQLGDGTRDDRGQVYPLSTLPRIIASAAYGEGHGLGVTFDGIVYAWGDNYFGQLGDNTTTASPLPQIISGLSPVRQVAAGDHHSLALLTDGTVWSWGGNQYGQLGDGTTANRAQPAAVPGLANIVAIAAGAYHSAALGADGTVWVWGSNEFGQMGDEVELRRVSPVAMSTLGGVTGLVSGRHHLLVLKADGSVFSWGANQAGQLGLADTAGRFVPEVIAGLPAIKALAAGTSHSVALATDGTVWTWGANEAGQLGNTTTTASSTPAANGFSEVAALASGRDHVLALKTDGSVWGWGNNEYGQLDDEAGDFSATPIFIYADE